MNSIEHLSTFLAYIFSVDRCAGEWGEKETDDGDLVVRLWVEVSMGHVGMTGETSKEKWPLRSTGQQDELRAVNFFGNLVN